jgi:hypothetical protein
MKTTDPTRTILPSAAARNAISYSRLGALFLGIGLGLLGTARGSEGTQPTASHPAPADGSSQVGTTIQLTWRAGDQVQAADGHLVFVGTEESEVAAAFYRNHPNVQVYVVSSPTLTLSNLGENTTYSWRVDQINEAVAADPWKGPVWRFKTGAADQATRFSDDFSVPHDYLADGMAGTGWDGFLGRGERQTADRILTDEGVLLLESAKGRYEAGGGPLGPLLYKTVTGDFKATIRVVDYRNIAYNNGGLMARASGAGVEGRGERWISVDYFPLYGGIYARMADGAQRHEVCTNEQGWDADRYLQLERAGSLFFLRHSPDGEAWTELSCSPITRNDLVNVPLQVGPFQATYTDNQGHLSFDEFTLEIGGHVKTARLQFPESGSAGIPLDTTLSWIPGFGATHHDVYFGASREAVEAAGIEQAPGAGVYRGRVAVDAIAHAMTGLEDGTTYYWRIDEVAGDDISRGDIWSFTTHNRVLGDFEAYRSTAELEADWRAGGTAAAALAVDGAHTGRNALQLNFDNAAPPHHAMIEYTFSASQDWMSSDHGFRWLTVHFKGDPDNRADGLCMIFEDNDWVATRTIIPYDGDPANLQRADWTRWDIDLQALIRHNPAFRLHSVKKMGLVAGHPQNPTSGGRGQLWFDDIALHIQRYGDSAEPAPSAPRFIRPDRFVEPVPFTAVRVADGLWRERMDVNRQASLPHVWDKCEFFRTGSGEDSRRLDNFRKAAGEMPGDFTGTYFNDSDVYKIIQGTAYSLQNHPDPELEAHTDAVIASIAGAQWEDGYLFTYYSLPRRPELRWSNIGSMHELYCAGHLIEAAVAYHEATGKRKLLDVAIRFADHIDATFGPGKKTHPPGHQEIELALMKLYHLTGQQKYMDLAKFFVDQRGRGEGRSLYGTYSQDHVPFIRQEKAVGHSVRAGYLFIAAADIALVNHDEAYGNALFRLWDNITNTKTYLTGGIGQPGGPEGFAGDYQLGNACYAETCSGIAFAMWNHRLHLMTGEAKYLDIMERTLLNNVLSSLSQDGTKHYYTNPLSHNGHRRWEWPGHDCACCPSNLARVIASIGGYAYTHRADAILVNLYLPSETTIPLPDNTVTLTQATHYPWDGEIRIAVQPERTGPFTLKLRIPGWAQNMPMPGNLYRYLDAQQEPMQLAVNDVSVPATPEMGYVTLARTWQPGDTIRLHLPMPIRRVIAHPKAAANDGLVAIERGPIVYCAEQADHDFPVTDLKLPDDVPLTAKSKNDLFDGAVMISGEDSSTPTLIPYFFHSNRTPGWMRVWFPR